ncbi:MAG TPA: OmpA family protein [Kofleriaceae bacterium]|nr:OmpA family protein [Kofleriaceae bacterium]
MRVFLAVLVVSTASPAFADPADRLEAGGFLGVDYFGDDIGLGSALAPEQRPQTAPILGGRLTYVALRTNSDIQLDVGGELELSFAPSWTGYGFEEERPSYFAPVFGFRGNLLARIGSGWLQPHAIVGAGGATVISSSPYMKKETDPVYFWGLGATFPVAGRWQLRFDGIQTRMPARDETGMGDAGTTSTYELRMSVAARFGAGYTAKTDEHVDVVVDNQPPRPPPPDPDKDSDNDGIPDRLDACPAEGELVNGVDDQDGCPEQDPDKDNLVGALDKCPDQPEDVDKFQDEDGCPDPDNDNDGVADANDACPTEMETKNGITDDDGCADQVPKSVTDALTVGKQIKFDPGKQRLKTATKAALDKVAAVLLGNRFLRIRIVVHPDADTEAAKALASKRAEAMKWYLNEQGVAPGQLDVATGGVAPKNAPVADLLVAP